MSAQQTLPARAGRTLLARLSCLTAAAVTLGASAALAHHPMGGQTPATLMDGLLSGLGHPVIGVDHLAFIVGIGLLAAISGFGPLLPVAFVAAMSAGLALHLAGVTLPGVELAVAASALLIGLALLRPRDTARRSSLASAAEAGVFALAGTFHGYALAESIVGAETTPLAGYLAGLLVCQMGIALIAYFSALNLAAMPAMAPALRLAPVRAGGLAIAAVGALFAARAFGLAA
jgi:urease accessory protein